MRGRIPLWVLLGVAAFVIVVGVGMLLRGRSSCRELGKVDQFKAGTVSYVECVPAFVVNSQGEIRIFLARASHLRNEPIEWEPRRRVFFSPFHGEEYTAGGRRLSGPGLNRLFECPFRMERDSIVLEAPTGAEPEDLRNSCGEYERLP